jgi:tRNA(Ile)-lysidine synthase
VRAAEPTGPIADFELPALFAPLDKASLIALAVSGGADSLALLDCADRWRRNASDAPKLLVLTVDHGLRPSSKTEAAHVAAIAKSRGIDARILRWTGRKPAGDIEAVARSARYQLLLAAAVEAGASHLLLAHHRDDQAETLLLRLARGSGLFGLAAMRADIRAGSVTLLRPLLSLPRARLRATAEAAGLSPVEDPMNHDARFARARIRRAMPVLAGEGIDAAGLAATAGRLAGAAEAIDAAAAMLLAGAVTLGPFATAAIDPGPFLAAPSEIRRRAFVRLLLAIGGDPYPPRHERLAALLREVEFSGSHGRFKRTLAGTIIELRRGRFILYREVGRAGLPTLAVKSGFPGIWDGRFQVEVAGRAPRGLRLAALGEAGRRSASLRRDDLPAGALEALPAFWLGEKLLAVPKIGDFAGVPASFSVSARSILPRRLAEPPLFPDFLGSG